MLVKQVKIADLEQKSVHHIGEIVRIACQYESKIKIDYKGHQINAKSIMGIMTFNPTKGMEVRLEVDGDDEAEAMEAVSAYISD